MSHADSFTKRLQASPKPLALIVEDEQKHREALTGFIEQKGWDVQAFDTYEKALEWLEGTIRLRKPQLILMDHEIYTGKLDDNGQSYMKGKEAIPTVKARHIPMIGISRAEETNEAMREIAGERWWLAGFEKSKLTNAIRDPSATAIIRNDFELLLDAMAQSVGAVPNI